MSTAVDYTTEIVYTTITSCPVTSTKTYGHTTSVEVTTSISTVVVTSTKTICTKCVAPQKTKAPGGNKGKHRHGGNNSQQDDGDNDQGGQQ